MGRWLPIGRGPGLVSGEELLQTQSPEQSLDGLYKLYREKVVRSGGYPAVAVEGETATRDDHTPM
jgi:hypothetical protein